MNDQRRTPGVTDSDEAERALKRLFAHVKPRPQPPADDAEEIRRAVLAEWDAVAGRRALFRRVVFSVAASMLLAVALYVGVAPDSGAPLPAIARVERVEGNVDSADGARLFAGSALPAGAVVTTGAGPIALRLATGGSLRVGPQSRVVLTGPDAVELTAGAVYFDSEDERAGADFTITTSLGSVRDVGTQFLTRFDRAAARLEVGVRDGRIELTTADETGGARVGERLVVTDDAPSIRRETMPTFGAEWDWAESVAPPFDIDGRTVSDFLAWFAAQTGRTVVFENADAERLARETVLNGAIDLAPLQKLSAVLALTDLRYTFDGERVVIDTR